MIQNNPFGVTEIMEQSDGMENVCLTGSTNGVNAESNAASHPNEIDSSNHSKASQGSNPHIQAAAWHEQYYNVDGPSHGPDAGSGRPH